MGNLYITPYNQFAKILAQSFDKQDKKYLFVDSYKYDNKNILNPNCLEDAVTEKIIIVHTTHYKQIYLELKKRVKKEKICFFDPSSQRYYNSILSYELLLWIKKCYFLLIKRHSLFLIKTFKNRHLNERCFVLGNGPSLKIEDLDKLKNEITFASNKIYLAFDQTNWRPNYYFVEDHLVLAQNYKEIISLCGPKKFFPLIALWWMPRIKSGIYYPLTFDFKNPSFSKDPSKNIPWGASVTTSMIQMAIYMGFKKIYLLGLDFNFIQSDKKISLGEHGVYLANGEKNHFHKDYRKKGEQWTVPDMKFQEEALKKIATYAKNNKIEIINCSRKTKLTVFGQSSLETILDE
jgi:hypothetical protein